MCPLVLGESWRVDSPSVVQFVAETRIKKAAMNPTVMAWVRSNLRCCYFFVAYRFVFLRVKELERPRVSVDHCSIVLCNNYVLKIELRMTTI